jgi:hypothetical protein
MSSMLLLLLTVLTAIPTLTRARRHAGGFFPYCEDGIRKDSLTIGIFTGNSADASTNENGTTTPTADYYYPCNPRVARKAPLVIIIPGVDAGKDKYSMAAKAFVDRGYRGFCSRGSQCSFKRSIWSIYYVLPGQFSHSQGLYRDHHRRRIRFSCRHGQHLSCRAFLRWKYGPLLHGWRMSARILYPS